MEERRDWGCLNCKRNSIDFAFIKTWYLSYLFDFSFNKNNWKLVLIRSQLYEQLWMRPKHHFSQNCKLYTFQRMTTTLPFKKQTFRATRSGAQNCAPQNEKKHLRTTVYNKEEVGEILVFHFPNPRIGVRQLSKTPTCTAHQAIVNPKFSAQSEPMVKSYDQNKFQAFSLKENDQKFQTKNWVSFADLPLSRPPCLSAVPDWGVWSSSNRQLVHYFLRRRFGCSF